MIALGCGLTFRASNMSYLFVGFQIIPLFSFFPIIKKTVKTILTM